MSAFDYHRPRTLEDARRLKAAIPGAAWVAGGTDLIVRIKQRSASPTALVSLRDLPELRAIEPLPDGSLRIGASARICEIARHASIARDRPALAQAARALGGVQIRNAATLGGNLCNASPCADTAPPLLVLDAWAEILGDDGTRRVAMSDFFRGRKLTALRDGELLAAIVLPPPTGRSVFLKKKRVAMDLAVASIAVWADIEGDRCRAARVAAGSLAPTPIRLPGVEAVLTGRALSDDVLREAQAAAEAEVRPITDVRGTEVHRRRLAGVFVRRAFQALWRSE